MATLHACLVEGADADAAVRSIKRRLAESHGIEHATVEPEFGACADAKPEHEHH
jgi:cobalt-zinc-cadmium efflux system protein